MNKNLRITKRNGKKEYIDLERIHRVIKWASEGLNNVSVSQVELNPYITFCGYVIGFIALCLNKNNIIRKINVVYVFIFIELYVENPNNKSPPKIHLKCY